MSQKLDELRTLAIALFEACEKKKAEHGPDIWGGEHPQDWRNAPTETVEVWEAVARVAFDSVTQCRSNDEMERADEAEEALRQISVMVCGIDPSDGEGTSPEEIVEWVKAKVEGDKA